MEDMKKRNIVRQPLSYFIEKYGDWFTEEECKKIKEEYDKKLDKHDRRK